MRGQWLIEQWYFNQTSVIAESLSLRNPALLKPAKRYMKSRTPQFKRKELYTKLRR